MVCSLMERFEIAAGTVADFRRLKAFHYRAGNPGAVTRVFTATYCDTAMQADHPQRSMIAAVAVESLPSLGCALRQLALPGVFDVPDRSLNAAKLNRDMRTISRVIVHPLFRSAGLAVRLVRHILDHAETPYVEALAAMGRVHPFFRLAGMREFDRPPLASHVRMLAALQRENLGPLSLVDAEQQPVNSFLRRELERFTGQGPGAAAETLIGRARERLLSQPVYYVWASTQGTQQSPQR